MSHTQRRRAHFERLSHRSMWRTIFWVGNNQKYSTCRLLLALINQGLCGGGQEVPPVPDILSKYAGTPCSCVFGHCCWSFHEVGDWIYYMSPGFNQWTSLHHVALDYFMKWVEAMSTFSNDGETVALFIFYQIVARFDIPKEIFTDHGSHFQNRMMIELTSNLRFKQEHSSPYDP
jgi:hypothetical protein